MQYKTHTEKQMIEQITEQKSEIPLLKMAESEPYRILTSEALALHDVPKAVVEEGQVQLPKAASIKSKGGK